MSERTAGADLRELASEWCDKMRRDPTIGKDVQLLQSLSPPALSNIIAFLVESLDVPPGKRAAYTESPAPRIEDGLRERVRKMLLVGDDLRRNLYDASVVYPQNFHKEALEQIISEWNNGASDLRAALAATPKDDFRDKLREVYGEYGVGLSDGGLIEVSKHWKNRAMHDQELLAKAATPKENTTPTDASSSVTDAQRAANPTREGTIEGSTLELATFQRDRERTILETRIEEAEWWGEHAGHTGPARPEFLDKSCAMCMRIVELRADLARLGDAPGSAK